MKLKALLKDVEVLSDYQPDREVRKIAVVSGEATEDSLFIAVKGERFDGEKYLAEAKSKNAVTVGEENADVLVGDAVLARNTIWRNFYNEPDRELDIIGVTGTNGKTTVTYLTRHIFEQTGIKTGVIGTVANVTGKENDPSVQTTPSPNELYRLFDKMKGNGLKNVCMEVSSHSLVQRRCSQLDFKAVAITNLTEDHLDYHGSMENYLNAKLLIVNQTRSLAVNLDDVSKNAFLEKARKKGIKVITYAINDKKADISAKKLELHKNKTVFSVLYDKKEIKTEINIPGEFSVYNALAAISLAVLCGVPFEEAATSIKSASGIKGRMESFQTKNGVTAIIDYAHTPDGLEKVLITLKKLKSGGRIITVFGCGGDREKEKRPKMGKIAAKYSDLVIITSDNPRSEEPHAIIEEIAKGSSAFKTPQLIIEDRRAAIKTAMQNAKRGDIVLLAGKGHENYQILKDKTVNFDEAEILKAYI